MICGACRVAHRASTNRLLITPAAIVARSGGKALNRRHWIAQQTRKMSAKLRGAKRLKGTDENVWNVYIKLAIDYKAVNLGQGFPDFSPPDHVKKGLADAAYGENHLLNQYTRGFGHPRLMNALAKVFSPMMGRNIDPMTEIIGTCGAYGALFCCFQAFIEEGDEVIIVDPSYDCYRPMTMMAGGIPSYVRLKPKSADSLTSADWALDKDELESAFNPKTKAIVINNPHNPLGKMYSMEELQFIADLCKKHDVLCISDEVYEWLQYDRKHTRIGSLPGMWERTITIGSAGKTFSVTGWKVGWGMGSADLIKHCFTVWQNSIYHNNTPSSEGVARAFETELARFDTPDCYFKSLPRELRDNRDKMARLLAEVGMKPIIPEGGYFMLADISGLAKKIDLGEAEFPNETVDSKFVKWMIKEKNVATIPFSAFYSEENRKMGENYIRFCFCKNQKTFDAMEAIFKKWKNEM